MTIPVSPRWLDQIKKFEGFRASAYRDPAGVWTVGYGFTKGVTSNTTISRAEADTRLIAELQEYASAVENLCAAVDLTEGQKDALIDFAYNLGVGALAKSTLLKCVLAGDVDGAAAQFGKWVYAGGRKLPGLVERRTRERERFLVPDTVAPEPPRSLPSGPERQDTGPVSPPVAPGRIPPPEPAASPIQPATQPRALPTAPGALSRQPDEPPPEPDDTVRPWTASKRIKAGTTLVLGSQIPGWVNDLWETFSDWFKNDPVAVETLWSHAVTLLAIKWVGYAIFAGGAAWLVWTFFLDRRAKG